MSDNPLPEPNKDQVCKRLRQEAEEQVRTQAKYQAIYDRVSALGEYPAYSGVSVRVATIKAELLRKAVEEYCGAD